MFGVLFLDESLDFSFQLDCFYMTSWMHQWDIRVWDSYIRLNISSLPNFWVTFPPPTMAKDSILVTSKKPRRRRSKSLDRRWPRRNKTATVRFADAGSIQISQPSQPRRMHSFSDWESSLRGGSDIPLSPPVQRVSQYDKYLSEYYNHTPPSHPDYSNVCQATRSIRSVRMYSPR